MTRPWAISSTGSEATIPARRPLLALLLTVALAASAAAPGPARAQTLKLRSLRIYPSDVVGPWVSYKVRTQSGRYAVREFTQRVAIVGKENLKGKTGYWVELKTSDPTRGVRIERGLFAERGAREVQDEGVVDGEGLVDGTDSVDDAGTVEDAESGQGAMMEVRSLRLVRYQVLTPDGKLYEYPAVSATSARAVGEVSTHELFEFDPGAKPVRRLDGPDTLRIGRRVVPSVVERILRTGSDDWQSGEDTTAVSRIVLSQIFWKNGAVPITGFARSLFRVTTMKQPLPIGYAGPVILPPPDSTALVAADDAAQSGAGPVLSWTELLLQDLGADAVAEVTQAPEPAPVTGENEMPAGPVR
jgi:hypothetical protein